MEHWLRWPTRTELWVTGIFMWIFAGFAILPMAMMFSAGALRDMLSWMVPFAWILGLLWLGKRALLSWNPDKDESESTVLPKRL